MLSMLLPVAASFMAGHAVRPTIRQAVQPMGTAMLLDGAPAAMSHLCVDLRVARSPAMSPYICNSSLATPIADVPVSPLDVSTVLLAKDEFSELFDDFFGLFPIIVSGGAASAFAVSYLKNLKPMQFDVEALPFAVPDLPLPELPAPVEEIFDQYGALILVPGLTLLFVVASKFGILNALAGGLAKGLLDGWNVFAGVALKGAYLKYK